MKGWVMDEIKNGGPAFPVGFQKEDCIAKGGMPLRDYFAAKAMHMVFEIAIHNWKQDGEEDLAVEFVAKLAYLMADAMLKAREVKNEL